MDKNEFFNRIFAAKAAKNGGIVRRKITAIEKHASFELLVEEVEQRGFHMIETKDQYVIVCNSDSCKFWF